jgi:hypothetical protein
VRRLRNRCAGNVSLATEHVLRETDELGMSSLEHSNTSITWRSALHSCRIAESIAKALSRPIDYVCVESDGAARAAALLADLI